MAWTYDATDLTEATVSGRRNIVRLIVGDTETTNQQLQNEEIDYFVDQQGDSVRLGAIQAVRALIGKYASWVDARMGHTLVEHGQLVRNYRSLLDELLNASDSYVVSIYVGGVSKAKNTTMDTDTDLVSGTFEVGMDSYDTTGSVHDSDEFC